GEAVQHQSAVAVAQPVLGDQSRPAVGAGELGDAGVTPLAPLTFQMLLRGHDYRPSSWEGIASADVEAASAVRWMNAQTRSNESALATALPRGVPPFE